MQFQENAQTDGRTEGQRHYFIGPFRLPLGVQQYHCKCEQHVKTKSQPSGLAGPPIYVYMYTLYYIIYVIYIQILSKFLC